MPQALTVMIRLDRAIHEKGKNFSSLPDGQIKPGHNNAGRGNLRDTTRSYCSGS